jgi:hypothetical protein
MSSSRDVVLADTQLDIAARKKARQVVDALFTGLRWLMPRQTDAFMTPVLKQANGLGGLLNR